MTTLSARPSPVRPRPPRRHRRRAGQSLVEFALILPAFLAILGGLLDGGFFLYSRMSVINAVRDGARWAVTQKDATLSINEVMDQATGPVRSNASDLNPSDLSITTTCVPAAGRSACDFDPGGARDASEGDSVRVSATYVYHSFFARLFGATVSLSATDQTVIE